MLYIRTASGREVVVLLEAPRFLSDTDRSLVEVFCSKLSVAFDNVILYEQLQDANAHLEERVARAPRELTAANERLAAQWERIRRANAFKSEMIGTVAHDLKNPLGVVMGRTEMLRDIIAMPSSMPTIAQRADRAYRGIRPPHARHGRHACSPTPWRMRSTSPSGVEPFDLATLVRDVVEASRPLADHKQQTHHRRRRRTRLIAHARLRPHLGGGRQPALQRHQVHAGRRPIDVFVEQHDNAARVAVHDNGLGLSPEDAGRLFGRFQRLSAKPTGGESSTGLGLSIVKRIVDLHGGRVTAESAGPQKGVDLQIILPLERSRKRP